jgi:hypothetical protein
VKSAVAGAWAKITSWLELAVPWAPWLASIRQLAPKEHAIELLPLPAIIARHYVQSIARETTINGELGHD